MKKLTKELQAERRDLVDRLRDRASELGSAIERFNEQIDKLKDDLEAAVRDYNEVSGEAREFAERVASEAESWREERSERWQESDTGQEHQTWLDEWQGFQPDDVEIEIPDKIQDPDPSAADDLEGLPSEP